VQHWKEGGHDTLCKKIKKAGGAEQYNANTKYSEAVAVAAEKCAEDTKGQTCYICTQTLHWKTKEGLVRGCACRGTSGVAHVSCLAEQAKILCDEAEENNLGIKAKNERWLRWCECSLCEQKYHGVVRCALGWACWKTYLGRPEDDTARRIAMEVLGSGLDEVGRHAEALVVKEAELSMLRRVGARASSILAVQTNLANTYQALGRLEHSLQLERDVYHGSLRLLGEEHRDTIISVNNLAATLFKLKRFEEAKSLLRKIMPVARRVLGENYELTIAMRMSYAQSLYNDEGATLDDLREAVTTLEENERIARRVFGGAHPLTMQMEHDLKKARAKLRARETLAEAMAAATLGDA
jgi:tetratricopeptide (TPR) repeat protein